MSCGRCGNQRIPGVPKISFEMFSGGPNFVIPPPDTGHMRKNQLVLIETLEADFRIDDRTKDLGRRGIAAAREALRSATEKVAA